MITDIIKKRSSVSQHKQISFGSFHEQPDK
jgi:hypothetical protein